MLVLSGHRLGRFNGDLSAITNFLNNPTYNLITAVPYYTTIGTKGKSHIYQIFYIDAKLLHIHDYTLWKKEGKQYKYINENGILFSISPSMSWQVWWRILIDKLKDRMRQIILN